MSGIDLPERNAFNALRLFCCLAIIAGHCLDLGGVAAGAPFCPRPDTHVCVCVFFILSGFFVTRSCLQRREAGEGAVRFYRRRAARILPPYYAVVLCCACGFYFFSGCGLKEYFTSSRFREYLFWNAVFLNFMCVSPVPKTGMGGDATFP